MTSFYNALYSKPLTLDERLRRMVQLCSSFMRNMAFHRAGLQQEVQSKLLKSSHPQAAFWREAHANFFDICVLDWCKLFTDARGEHHWCRVVSDRQRFQMDLCIALGIEVADFEKLVKKIKRYRDKFIAHLDQDRIMDLPFLDTPKKSVVFLHEHLVPMLDIAKGQLPFPKTPEQLELGYLQALREAESVYDQALFGRKPIAI
jgi:hypothetical protein